MTRQERKAWQARAAVMTLAQMAAKRAVKAHIRAQGLRLGDFSSKEIGLWAEVWLRENPCLFAQARVTAVELGFAPGEQNARDTRRPYAALSKPDPNAGVAPSGQAREAGTPCTSLSTNPSR
jgi:hypothetical protein